MIAPIPLRLRAALGARLPRPAAGFAELALALSERLKGPAPSAGTLAALGALQRVMGQVARRIDRDVEPGIVLRGLQSIDAAEPVPASLDRMDAAFEGTPCASELSHELLVLSALIDNPALGLARPLIEDPVLSPDEAPGALRLSLDAWLDENAPPEARLPALLRAPAREHPDSLQDQLTYALELWGDAIGDELRNLLLRAGDAVREEATLRAGGAHHDGGRPEQPVLDFASVAGPAGVEEADDPRFSEDRSWMAEVVLMAKHTYVWLDQLSKLYGHPVERLDQIPDEELDKLAARGFSGLWLIGLWERSPASRDIKRTMGNPEAESSAYALFDYRIADRLGGEGGYQNLRDRAGARGIRLAADMVPNHVGVDGRWVNEHPEWFVQADHPPFPNYSFGGPDLGTSPDVGVYLEQGYWDHSDAAVVFQRVDRRSGDVRYIFHGNDGTTMPWNDTAQLDFTLAEVRQAVSDVIVDVARRFPIIRFDAAMTLARRHVRRLWHPAPGEGGAIASRSWLAMSPEEFDQAMPREFWREVVERVAAEAPDTLLLAEAFWMMEGYFVRNLGMHRVYNSGFMHMLRDEDNEKYRKSLASILEYSPAILERFVNFVSNPDEPPAAEQLGRGDKYFGIATLMSTLPGTPMFGHGQLEGFEEKYGMEYARAYRDEVPDEGFVRWHEQVICPLLRNRRLFSGVADFQLYDFVGEHLDHNVYAFSNRSPEGGRSLVVFNNAHTGTAGWMHRSVPALRDDELRSRTLGEGLGLSRDVLYGLRELRTGQWFLRAGHELHDKGLFAQLDGYGVQVFMDFRELHGDGWWRFAEHLDGRGVDNIDAAYAAHFAPPIPPQDPKEPDDTNPDDTPIPGGPLDDDPKQPGGRKLKLSDKKKKAGKKKAGKKKADKKKAGKKKASKKKAGKKK